MLLLRSVMLPGVELIIDIGMNIGYRPTSKRFHPAWHHQRGSPRASTKPSVARCA